MTDVNNTWSHNTAECCSSLRVWTNFLFRALVDLIKSSTATGSEYFSSLPFVVCGSFPMSGAPYLKKSIQLVSVYPVAFAKASIAGPFTDWHILAIRLSQPCIHLQRCILLVRMHTCNCYSLHLWTWPEALDLAAKSSIRWVTCSRLAISSSGAVVVAIQIASWRQKFMHNRCTKCYIAHLHGIGKHMLILLYIFCHLEAIWYEL